MLLYGIDISKSSNYDMVLNISTMGVEEAASIIVQAAGFPCYQATDHSMQVINDLALESEVKAALFDFPQSAVNVHNGDVHIRIKVPQGQAKAIQSRIESAVEDVEGLASMAIAVSPYY